VVIATLEKEGRNPNAYNLAGIMRDAFYDLGPGFGFEAAGEEKWRQAVDTHRRPFGVGDMVRVVVEQKDGRLEHHYGRIDHFQKTNGGRYRGTPTRPAFAYIELEHWNAYRAKISEVTAIHDDFEVFREWSDVHRGALNKEGYFYCLRCASYTYKGARVMLVHKVSGQRVRVCDECFGDGSDQMARLGYEVVCTERMCQDTVEKLTANPELIVDPASDSYYQKSEGEIYREWADLFAWLVPAPAAALYEQWKAAQQQAVAA
jgi:hypothetical protein